jgi:ubiquinone/menaquinone biosynthesis C-methylase UbiE
MFRRRTEERPRTKPRDWRSYDAVAESYEEARTPVHQAPVRDLVEAVAPPAGGRVLDVGTGPGIAAQAAQGATGPDGLVVGIDPSVPMLRIAKGRGVRAVAAEAIDLPFPDATFDAVVASFVIFMFPRYETALFDMLRVLRPGGRLGATTWASTDDEFRRTWREVAESFAGREILRGAMKQAAPWEDRFSDPARLAETLQDAGLRQVDVEERSYRSTQSIEQYLLGREVSANGRFLKETLGESLWERFTVRVEEEFRKRFPDPLGDTIDVLVAVGTKPR